MKRSPFASERTTKSVAISIAIHVVVLATLAGVSLDHFDLIGASHNQAPPVQHITFVTPQRTPIQRVDTSSARLPRQEHMPAAVPPPPLATEQLVSPGSIPTTMPARSSDTMLVGNGTKNGVVGGKGIPGVTPLMPDPRVELNPPAGTRTPRSNEYKVDSAIAADYAQYQQAALDAQAHPGRSPKDWTTTIGGQKVGWDSVGFRLGKFTIPNALLGLLKTSLPVTGENMNTYQNGLAQSAIHSDLAEHMRGVEGMDAGDLGAAQKRMKEIMDLSRLKARQGAHRDTIVTASGSRGGGR